MTFALRKARAAFPAALVAIAMGGAALTVTPAQAADVPAPKVDIPAPQVVSDVKLRQRVEAALENPPAAEAARPEGVQAQEPGTAAEAPAKRPGGADPKIIGGVEVPASSIKWMVQVYTPEGTFCSGTLIAPAKVLTAAHCAYGMNWNNDKEFVVGGATQRLSWDAAGTPDLHGGKVATVKRVWTHPSYNDSTLKGDVAVLTLDRPLHGLPTLKYAPPTEKAGYVPGTKATVYGWGRTSGAPGSPASEKLKSASIPVQADSVCPGWDEAKSDFVPGFMFCGGNPASGTDAGTVSPCNGDSGGPLVVGGRIVGVVSWGIQDCIGAGARSVYAKVGTVSVNINHAVDDASWWDQDGSPRADLLARNKTSKHLFSYQSRGRSLAPGVNEGLFDAVTLVRQADMDRDGNQDLIYRTYNGKLYWSRAYWNENLGENGDYEGVETLIGSGWGSFKNVYIPGDISGDTYPDIIATDNNGVMWMWKGRASGTIQAPVKIGTGWSGTAVFAKGDFDADGKPDLLARDNAKNLLLYSGTGSATAPIGAKRIVGRGWAFNGYAAIGDVSGDTHPDFMARDAAGKLWVYPGTGRSTKIFDAATRYSIASGWNSFDLLG
ncbi:trypsin-like serine protease [Streptomyces sp. NPDC050504]|uniref:trypsin-like serine protease n=1 Tax=Streptomyces sp. NPDC050504 TaxID=3365618 RepID=UPI0037A9D112